MNIPEGLKYTNDHEYLKMDGNVGIIGVTDYAQSELGDIIFVDVTVSLGADVKAGDSLGSIEAVKTVSEVFSPISGKIVGINDSINDSPSVVNEDPYVNGWIIKIEPVNMDEVNNLLDSKAYSELVNK